jgi:uncharacterized protein (DUF849 family)
MNLEAALNGSRSLSEHPAIPRSPVELARSARDAVAAGADALHFHVRDRDGRESLAPEDVAAAVNEVRRAGVPFGVSTGAWIISEPERRLATVRRWTVLPDFVSVNFHEAGAAGLAAHFLALGVGIEAGIADRLGAERLVESGLADRCLRIMLEPQEQNLGEASALVELAERMLQAARVKSPRLLHGFNRTTWPLLEEAGRRGWETRIGLEDTLTLPDGTVAPGNAELVRAAAALLKSR